MVKKFFVTLLILGLLFVAYLFYNVLTFDSRQIEVTPLAKIEVSKTAKDRMAQAISIRTISNENPAEFDSAAFYQFRDFVQTSYPLTDSLLEKTYINEFSLIYKWQGSNPELKPVIILGHLDVVPVAENDINKWTEPPFSGKIVNGVIWGRGTIDDKISVIGNLEAAEHLLQKGYKPQRTIYFCFGHDEELGGKAGAIAIVEHLENMGVEAEFVLDEGFAITKGLVPGIETEVALIGTAEKGFVTAQLSIDMEGGHSSMPAPETAVDVMATAITKLKNNPFPATITPPLEDFMSYIGPEMPFVQKLAFANPAVFKSMILSIYQESPSGNATVRTTTSPTIFQAGIKENVIPTEANASVNFRVLPGTSTAEVLERVRTIINDDRISVTAGPFISEPSPVSSTDTKGYQTIERTIKELFPNAITTPNLVVGGTDSRHYTPLTNQIFRFTPFYLTPDNINTFHGIDERIPVDQFEDAIRFYTRLIQNSTSE